MWELSEYKRWTIHEKVEPCLLFFKEKNQHDKNKKFLTLFKYTSALVLSKKDHNPVHQVGKKKKKTKVGKKKKDSQPPLSVFRLLKDMLNWWQRLVLHKGTRCDNLSEHLSGVWKVNSNVFRPLFRLSLESFHWNHKK